MKTYRAQSRVSITFYVVCCMECGEKLKKALKIRHQDYGLEKFRILLGVARMILPHDSSRFERDASSSETRSASEEADFSAGEADFSHSASGEVDPPSAISRGEAWQREQRASVSAWQ